LAQAVVNASKEKKQELFDVKEFDSMSGKGVEGKIGKDIIIIGNIGLMKENKISIDNCREKLEELEHQAKTVIVAARNGKVIGLIAIADTLKEDSKEAIEKGLTDFTIHYPKFGKSDPILTAEDANGELYEIFFWDDEKIRNT